jgi:MYXO-CTERM domain-containing protein
VEFFVYGEELRLTLTDSVTPWSARLVRGAWQDFIFRVKWSSDPSVGFVELWHNGQLVLPRYKHATMYPGDGIYLKLGLYRSDTVQPVGVVYHDGFVQATQLEDVLPLGPRPDAGTPAPDAGTPAPDAGTPAPDAGTGSPSSPGESAPPLTPTFPQPDTGVSVPTFPDESSPHGCSSTGGSFWAVALLGLGGLVRRIRRR